MSGYSTILQYQFRETNQEVSPSIILMACTNGNSYKKRARYICIASVTIFFKQKLVEKATGQRFTPCYSRS